MSTDKERKALKWMIGIVSFVIWVAVGRGLIFGGDAPKVYNAAHVSRKTYSAIAGNELRPVSKAVAVQFALALQLTRLEADEFLKAAGYAFSPAILEDIIVCACIEEKVYDVAEINGLLSEYDAKPFAPKEDA